MKEDGWNTMQATKVIIAIGAIGLFIFTQCIIIAELERIITLLQVK